MPALNKILKSFNKTLAQLEAVVTTNTNQAASKLALADQLEDEAIALQDEAAKAQGVAKRIRELVGEDA
jgi:hypothetical protein